MPMSNKTQPLYRMCVRGRLSQTGAAWFEGFTLTVDETTRPPQTRLEGPVMDQAALHGLISRIRDLGLTLKNAPSSSRVGYYSTLSFT